MFQRTLVILVAAVSLLGAPGAALAAPVDDGCTIPILGWQSC